MKIATIVLTYNEEIHLERCIKSIRGISKKIWIIDSFSNDKTSKISKKYNVKLFRRKFVNQSEQFNWAIKLIPKKYDWILRIDADEYLSFNLIKNIKAQIKEFKKNNIKGIYFNRRFIYQNKTLNYGGLSNIKSLRMFRNGYGKSEERNMDEHIIVKGKTASISGIIYDHNLKDTNHFISKHIDYAKREALDYFIYKFKLNNHKKKLLNSNNSKNKFIFYYRFPKYFRAVVYFLYRYFILFGFLDGFRGFKFHFIQALFYRIYVDNIIRKLDKRIKTKKDLIKFMKQKK